MSNITKTHKLGILAIFVAAALVGTFVTVASDNNLAFATKKHKSNDADQAIEQDQNSDQGAQCVSGDITLLCGNNVDLQFQDQEGNLALGQQ